jgi:hypothetical protein
LAHYEAAEEPFSEIGRLEPLAEAIVNRREKLPRLCRQGPDCATASPADQQAVKEFLKQL